MTTTQGMCEKCTRPLDAEGECRAGCSQGGDAAAALEAIARELGQSAAWTGETFNHIAEICERAGYPLKPADPPAEGEIVLKCPECGTTDVKLFKIRETFSAYHSVRGVKDGKVCIKSALAMTSPSEHFSEGECDFHMECEKCMHFSEPEKFGMPNDSEWEWV